MRLKAFFPMQEIGSKWIVPASLKMLREPIPF